MKKLILLAIGCFLTILFQQSLAQTDTGKLLDTKLDKAAIYLKSTQNMPKVWELISEIATIVKAHPEYDDGEYAEGMNEIVTELLMKPWKYNSAYLIGNKHTSLIQNFVIDHINELSTPDDLKVIKNNLAKNCDQTTYSFCKKLMKKVENSYTH